MYLILAGAARLSELDSFGGGKNPNLGHHAHYVPTAATANLSATYPMAAPTTAGPSAAHIPLDIRYTGDFEIRDHLLRIMWYLPIFQSCSRPRISPLCNACANTSAALIFWFYCSHVRTLSYTIDFTSADFVRPTQPPRKFCRQHEQCNLLRHLRQLHQDERRERWRARPRWRRGKLQQQDRHRRRQRLVGQKGIICCGLHTILFLSIKVRQEQEYCPSRVAIVGVVSLVPTAARPRLPCGGETTRGTRSATPAGCISSYTT